MKSMHPLAWTSAPILPDRFTVVPSQVADRQNAESFPFELVDLFHVFPPEQMSALLCIPESGLTPALWGAGEFSTGTLGIIAPALTTLPGRHPHLHTSVGMESCP